MKTAELTDAKLDYWVAKAEGFIPTIHHLGKTDNGEVFCEHVSYKSPRGTKLYFSPSTDWSQAGPIIEREKLHISYDATPAWYAQKDDDNPNSWANGETPLIAAMRTFVASKFGDEVPEET